MKLFLLSLLAAAVIGTSSPARADVFDWIESSQDRGARLMPLFDPHVDMALRVELIRSARRTIHLATYHQTTDAEVGLPLLHALRAAAARGVRIKLVTGRWPALLYDRDDLILKMLTDPRLKQPAKVVEFGGISNRRKGWNASDSMHEKLLIIDDELAFIGGRNHGADYLRWLDFAAVVVDERSRGLVAQARRAFDQLWFDMASFAEPLVAQAPRASDLPDPNSSTEIPLSFAQRQTLAQLLDWARQSAARSTAEEFRPARARVLTHRFFDLLATGKYHEENRLSLPDSIVEQSVRAIDAADEIRLATMYVLLHPAFKAALARAAARILTNGDVTARETVPLALSYKDSLEDLLVLLGATRSDGTPADVQVAVLGAKNYRYMHKKMLVADGTVVFGSHNFNLPSTIVNSEVALEVADSGFAQAMTERFDRDFVNEGEPLTIEQAARDFDSSPTGRWLAKFVHGFF